ncbi:MAG: cytochrome c biogenesis protein CcdA [Nanoarchaeota archaeon]|nr:cytochrome c biogenesis protein CcdA [Nanoarchaeota archaeon]
MISLALISVAIAAGFVTFISPCGIAMLPAYVSYYIGREKSEKNVKKDLFNGLKNGLFVSFGLISIFMIIGAIIVYIGNFIKFYIPIFTLVVGLVLIIIGFFMLFNKNFSFALPFHLQPKKKINNGFLRFYTFGIGYGLAVMSCTLPVFLAIIISALSTGSVIDGIFIFLIYSVAAAVGVVGISVITAMSKVTIMKKFSRIFPYVRVITAVVIIIAGSYIIYYQIAVNRAFAIFV